MKKLTSLIVTVVLVWSIILSLFEPLAHASNSDDKPKKYTFAYHQMGGDGEMDCWYSDSYFKATSYEYYPSLSTMSLCLSLATFGDANQSYEYHSRNATKLLDDIGFEGVEANDDFKKKPTADSIGAVAGHRKINEYTLIALSIRGSSYEQEWASNLKMGAEGNHQGFNEAKDKVYDFLKSYISDNKISGKIKLWMTGYSRGAVVANLLGGQLDEGNAPQLNITLEGKDLFVYTYGTPAGVDVGNIRKDVNYDNIYNVLIEDDFVPKIIPSSFGLKRYGQDIEMHMPKEEEFKFVKDDILEVYKSLETTKDYPYTVDDFKMKKISWLTYNKKEKKHTIIRDDKRNKKTQSQFVDEYVDIIAREFVLSRSNYVKNYQQEMIVLSKVLFAKKLDDSMNMLDSVIEKARKKWGDFLLSYLWNKAITGNEEEAFKQLTIWIEEVADENGVSYDDKELKKAVAKVGELMVMVFINYPNETATLLKNTNGFAVAHFPELCFAFFYTQDMNY